MSSAQFDELESLERPGTTIRITKLLPIGATDGPLVYVSSLPDLLALEGLDEGQQVSVSGTIFVKTGDDYTLKGVMTPKVCGGIGDGQSLEDSIFVELEAEVSGVTVDLLGGTYQVNSLPIGNTYINGKWLLGPEFSVAEERGKTYASDDNPSVISDPDDTGAAGAAYTGGVNNTPTRPGRSNRNRRVIVGSQNCRSSFNISGNYSCIYCSAEQNVSGNAFSRQSVAACPQGGNICAEEGQTKGFGGLNANVQFSITNGTKCGNLTTRLCNAESARYAQNVSSVSSKAGGGWGAILTPVFSSGALTSVNIVNAGQGYNLDHRMFITARQSQPTTEAELSFTVNSSGAIASVTVVSGGSGYNAADINDIRVQVPDDTAGECATNIATIVARSHGRASLNAASLGVENYGDASLIGSSENGATTTKGSQRQTILGSSGGKTGASGATLISGTLSEANHLGSVVIGRRVASASDRSFVMGDGSSGNASTSNRRAEITVSGNVNVAGLFTGSSNFTDYAELFENELRGEILLGTLVELEGRKVRPANGKAILGVISGTALIVAGDTPFSWAQRYLVGEFGEPIYEDRDCVDFEGYSGVIDDAPTPIPDGAVFYTERVRKENPDYDPTATNTPRSERKEEWSTVGLLGQVYVRVSEGVKEGDYLLAVNGVGASSDSQTSVRVMEIAQPYDASKGYAVAFCLLRPGV